MTDVDALATALHGDIRDDGWNPVVANGGKATLDCDVLDHTEEAARLAAALTASGYTIVESADLLDIARIAGADLSGIDDPRQLVQPSLIEFAAEHVRYLRDAYAECLDEAP